jgi:hypothetical protein
MIIYAICLVVGLLFTLVSAVAGHFFGGQDGQGCLSPFLGLLVRSLKTSLGRSVNPV